ncbi:MAG: GNAT family N-acetyltransferase [Flavobacteriales bacterium]|jgi:RimJ/RimL family protein N-acetyltransferase
MSVFLKGNSIELRALDVDDVNEQYLTWINDPEVTKGLASGYWPTSMTALKQFVSSMTAQSHVSFFAIVHTDTQKHIGNIKIDRFDWIARTCELGILIGDRHYHGKGIGTEACQLVIDYAFTRLNIRKILLSVYSNNPGAIRLYEKLGFTTEGCLREHVFENGSYHDKMYMSIFNPHVK